MCIWDIRALYGTRVKLTVIEAVLEGGCVDNKLTIMDDTPENQNSSLRFPGLSAQCGQSAFPPTVLISKGMVTVTFVSSAHPRGPVKFKLHVEASQPEYCPSNLIPDSCPNGPCCEGEDCCILHAGTVAKG